MTTIPDSSRKMRISNLTRELSALTTNIARDNSMDYIRMQFYYMYGADRYDKDGWDTEISSARIAVYNNGQVYRPDTYYTLELVTSDVIILYEYQRVEHYNESWQVYIRVPDINNSSSDTSHNWILIPNFELIQDVGTDFERELIYTFLKYTPEPGFDSLTPNYDTLPATNEFMRMCDSSSNPGNDAADNPHLGSLLD